MTKRRDEIKAAVNPVINNMTSVQSTFIVQIPLKLLINVGNNCLKAEEQRKQSTYWSGTQAKSQPKEYIKLLV